MIGVTLILWILILMQISVVNLILEILIQMEMAGKILETSMQIEMIGDKIKVMLGILLGREIVIRVTLLTLIGAR